MLWRIKVPNMADDGAQLHSKLTENFTVRSERDPVRFMPDRRDVRRPRRIHCNMLSPSRLARTTAEGSSGTVRKHFRGTPRAYVRVPNSSKMMRMKTSVIRSLLATAFAGALTLSAAPITPTFSTFGPLAEATFGGSGIPNHAVAITTYSNVTLGLTAHQRYFNPPVGNNGAGDFYAVKGADTYSTPPQPSYARWNFAFYALNMSGSHMYLDLLYDFDPGAGTDQSAHGRLSVLLPTVSKAEYAWQDSWNLGMAFLSMPTSGPGFLLIPPSGSFNPNIPGEYTFALVLRDKNNAEVARTAIRVNVLPDSGATAILLALSVAGLAGLRRRH